jgi:hypothetical protein
MEQWRSYMDALQVSTTAEDERAVDAVAPAGTTAIPRYTDPAYPIEGRPGIV